MEVRGERITTPVDFHMIVRRSSWQKPERMDNMNVIVDRDLCIGCGLCASICPEVFEMDDEGKAIVSAQPAERTDTLKEAIDSCPTTAISIE